MMTREIVTLLGDSEVGRLRQERSGRFSFEYDVAWQRSSQAYPLSLSMPLVRKEHEHAAVNAFLWGLLPDSELILERWAARFRVSSRNPFSLLTHVGADCAGAVRLVAPDRLRAVADERGGSVDWLTEKGVADRLRELHDDVSAWRRVSDSGQFSLAGAQPKTALLFDGKRWGIPSGRIPTTHILKPGVAGLEGHATNEHFCLALARELGLPVARSQILHFEDQVAIAVERYDRLRRRDAVVRVHQEDVCQALAVHPVHKYENDGGPGARAIADLLRENSRQPNEDINTFVAALAYGWIVAATDGHAKNYSLLIGAEGRVRLAPLYDVASALPYRGLPMQKLKLAMKIGGKYRIRDIGPYQFGKLAADLDLDEEEVLARIHDMVERLPDQAIMLLKEMGSEGLSTQVLRRLSDALCTRAKRCTTELGRASGRRR